MGTMKLGDVAQKVSTRPDDPFIVKWLKETERRVQRLPARNYIDLKNGLRLVIRPSPSLFKPTDFTLEAWRSGEAPFKRDAKGDVQLGSSRMRLLQKETAVIEREAARAGLVLRLRRGYVPEKGTPSPEPGLDYAVIWNFDIRETEVIPDNEIPF